MADAGRADLARREQGHHAAFGRRTAAIALALSRDRVIAVRRAFHRARPQSGALSGEPGAAGFLRRLWTSGRYAGSSRPLSDARLPGRGARSGLAHPAGDGRHCRRGGGRHRAGSIERRLVQRPGAGRDGRGPRAGQHRIATAGWRNLRTLARLRAIVRGVCQCAVSEQCDHRHHGIWARHCRRRADIAAAWLSGIDPRGVPGAALQSRIAA